MKFSLIIGAVLLGSSLTAQEGLQSKRGIPLLPEAGEYGIGVSASPFLSFLGNAMNGTFGNNEPSWETPSNPFQLSSFQVSGKRMESATQAYRFRLQLSANSETNNVSVLKDTLVPSVTNPSFGTDTRKSTSNYVALAFGKEWRRGKSRVQGVFGGEGFLEFGSQKSTFTYQNGINQDFNAPTSTNFGTNLLGPGGSQSAIRVLNQKSGMSFGIGVRGFAGVEYFIAPRLSLGAEFGWGISFVTASMGESETETFDPTSFTVIKNTRNVGVSGRSISAGLDNLSGIINLQFYF